MTRDQSSTEELPTPENMTSAPTIEQPPTAPTTEIPAPSTSGDDAPFPRNGESPSSVENDAAPATDTAAGVKSKVWTAADASPVEQPTDSGIRIGQLIWACIVILTGVFLIAMAFLSHIDLPLLLIGLVAVLGVALIGAAFFVGKDPVEQTSH